MFHTSKKRLDKRLHRRGQFTIFVILGMVIFIAFAFAVYAKVRIVNSMLGEQADVQLNNYLTNNAINQYVTSCLEIVTDDVLITASMQGGLLNSTGKSLNEDYIEYYDPTYNRTFNVSIIIDVNDECPDGRPAVDFIVKNESGPYPYGCRPEYVKNLPERYLADSGDCRNNCTRSDFRLFSGFFGVNNMSMLCNDKGANNPRIVPGASTCEYYSYYRKSLQQLLEEKITHDMGICVNLTKILEATPSNITMVGNANTTIQFTREGFSVKSEYPFTITMRNKQPVTRLVNFGIDKDIPFKELYEYTYELANYDVKDARFGILNDRDKVLSKGFGHRGSNMYKSYFEITITEGNVSNNYTRLVQVTDKLHKIQGVPLMMNFGVKNRRPVLDYIHNPDYSLYDLVAVENRTILITPQGYDPDDEQILNYTYRGWLEDYTDFYNFSDIRCSSPDSFEYILENCTKRNLTGTPKNNWTTSTPYIDTHQNASYEASALDVGLHNVMVVVRDKYGLEDHQTVRILVFDLPVAIINGSNGYDDVEPNRASYEDIYILSGAESAVGRIAQTFGISLSEFLWNDTAEPFSILRQVYINDPSTKRLVIPNNTDANIDLLNMSNIKNYTFRNTTDDYSIHNITLTVFTSDGLSDKAMLYVNVSECLNHSNDDNPPYPYNDYPNDLIDALMADHRCCTDYMTYEDETVECYNEIYYAMNGYFVDNSDLPDTREYTPIPNYNGANDHDSENDIFQQNFTSYCSGDRGNTCTGDIVDTRTDILFCDDHNNPGGLLPGIEGVFDKERCSGPEVTGPSTSPIVCQNYGYGNSFEREHQNNIGSTGECTHSPQCSDGSEFLAYNPGITTIFECTGYCSDDLSGECDSAVSQSCRCSVACDNTDTNPVVNVNTLCDGIGTNGYGDPISHSCGAENRDFADVCSLCALNDLGDDICRSDAYAGDCEANPLCNNVTINQPAKDSNNQPFCLATDRTRWAVCDSSCEPIEIESTLRCRAGPGCDTSTRCGNQLRNRLIPNSNDLDFCTSGCQYRTCAGTPYKFNTTSGTCFSGCTVAGQNTYCSPGHRCVGGQCIV